MKAFQGVGEHLVKRGGQWAFSLVMDGVRAHGSNNSLGGHDSMSWFWRHRQGCESLLVPKKTGAARDMDFCDGIDGEYSGSGTEWQIDQPAEQDC